MDTSEKIITILADRLPEARKELDKLVRKAARYGNPDVGYSVGEVFWTEERRMRFDGKEVVTRGPDRVNLTIVGEAPRVGSYEFLAKIEHSDAGNILDLMPGRTVGTRFRSTKSMCEHCHTDRRRNETFVLRNVDTGAEVQVGRTCLKDFLGYCNPAEIAQRFAFFKAIQDESEESWGGRGWGDTVPVDEAIALTFAAIRLWGWSSKGAAQVTGNRATADNVRLVINPPFNLYKDYNRELLQLQKELKAEFRDPADWLEAVKVLDWLAQGGAGDGDYGYNLKTICARGVVEGKRMGLVCSAVQAYERAMERQVKLAADREAAKESSWVGSEGERLKGLTVTQQSARAVGGNAFGELVLVKFVDDHGNVFTWFTGSGSGHQNNDRLVLTGTVKRHTEYQGAKETQLSRCKLEKVQ